MIDGIEIIHVVAFDQNNAIGFNNKLPWSITDDLKHFKEVTHNSIVLMGRKTFESIGKALPHRENVVISGNTEWTAPNTLRFGRIDTALAYCVSLAKHQNKRCVHIIGGAEIYKQTLAQVDKIIATEVELQIPDADAYYPKIDLNEYYLENTNNHSDSVSGIRFRVNIFNKII